MIKANKLGKCYRIYDTPMARLKQALWRQRKQFYREFWALKNISFEVKRGESLGIIGRNGSGKSTLLQLICGTLTPTEGSLSANGRIAALLELGSGFNPEFTGLENVYLNASLLGLSKEETNANLEDILAFADIGEFAHQPVKSYSSGMTVRLAFAVIAHVNADILVVDEALAVGDAIFVQRCMRFIRKMREERCLLFVSHEPETVKSLCSHALWLSNGSTQAYGKCRSVTLEYLRYCQAATYGEEALLESTEKKDLPDIAEALEAGEHDGPPSDISSRVIDYGIIGTQINNLAKANGWKTGSADLIEVSLKPIHSKEQTPILRGGEEVEIIIRAKIRKALTCPVVGFIISDKLGQTLVGDNTLLAINPDDSAIVHPNTIVEGVFRMWLPMFPSGSYVLTAAIAEGKQESLAVHHWIDDAILIVINASRVRHGLAGAFISSVELNIFDA
jgi:lipopolysaccharide transport system ATP-binding protein